MILDPREQVIIRRVGRPFKQHTSAQIYALSDRMLPEDFVGASSISIKSTKYAVFSRGTVHVEGTAVRHSILSTLSLLVIVTPSIALPFPLSFIRDTGRRLEPEENSISGDLLSCCSSFPFLPREEVNMVSETISSEGLLSRLIA